LQILGLSYTLWGKSLDLDACHLWMNKLRGLEKEVSCQFHKLQSYLRAVAVPVVRVKESSEVNAAWMLTMTLN
jgi:hypothetical protein